MAGQANFHWDDPLLLDAQLSEDERAVRDAAQQPSKSFRAGLGTFHFLMATLPC